MAESDNMNNTTNSGNTALHRRVRSFVRREGRFTQGQQRAFNELWPSFGLDYSATELDLNKVFGRSADTILEIGFGNGDSLAIQAEQFSHYNYFGIEVHRPGAGQLLQKIHTHKLSNVRVSTHDAVEVLKHQIPNHSLKGVQIFFPDPWPKKRHHKRRIIQSSFMNLVSSKLIADGFVHLATDWENYAEHMFDVMQNHEDFKNTSTDFTPRPDSRPLTKFEQRGLKLGHKIFDLMFVKSG